MFHVFFVEFVVIHNGIITNYKDLKAFLVGLKECRIRMTTILNSFFPFSS